VKYFVNVVELPDAVAGGKLRGWGVEVHDAQIRAIEVKL
jgi:hypothetical protein